MTSEKGGDDETKPPKPSPPPKPVVEKQLHKDDGGQEEGRAENISRRLAEHLPANPPEWIMAVATVFYVVVASFQLSALRDTNDLTRRAVENTERATDLTKRALENTEQATKNAIETNRQAAEGLKLAQASLDATYDQLTTGGRALTEARQQTTIAGEALHTAQRATIQFLGVEAPTSLKFFLPQRFIVSFKNSGHTQATYVTGIVNWQWPKADVAYPVECFRPVSGPGENQSQSDVGAGEGFSMYPTLIDHEVNRVGLSEWQEGRRGAFVCGEVNYTDAFGHNWKRVFCQTFQRSTERWMNCSAGNREMSVK